MMFLAAKTEVGARLKAIRKQRGITLTELSERTDLSLGFLSKLEHDKTSPTLVNLHKICEAMGVTLNDLLSDGPVEETPLRVVRASERPVLLTMDNGALAYYSVTRGHTVLQATALEIRSDKLYESAPHAHDELGIVSRGALRIWMDGKDCVLWEGDSIYIPAGSSHSIQRVQDGPCSSYWIKLSASVVCRAPELDIAPESEQLPPNDAPGGRT